MVYRRLFRQGSSTVVVVPEYMLEALGVSCGDYLLIEQTPGPALKCTGASMESVRNLCVSEKIKRQRERDLARERRGRRSGVVAVGSVAGPGMREDSDRDTSEARRSDAERVPDAAADMKEEPASDGGA